MLVMCEGYFCPYLAHQPLIIVFLHCHTEKGGMIKHLSGQQIPSQGQSNSCRLLKTGKQSHKEKVEILLKNFLTSGKCMTTSFLNVIHLNEESLEFLVWQSLINFPVFVWCILLFLALSYGHKAKYDVAGGLCYHDATWCYFCIYIMV